MNGSWMPYGQRPIAFVKWWKQFVNVFRNSGKALLTSFAWTVNSGNGSNISFLTTLLYSKQY